MIAARYLHTLLESPKDNYVAHQNLAYMLETEQHDLDGALKLTEQLKRKPRSLQKPRSTKSSPISYSDKAVLKRH